MMSLHQAPLLVTCYRKTQLGDSWKQQPGDAKMEGRELGLTTRTGPQWKQSSQPSWFCSDAYDGNRADVITRQYIASYASYWWFIWGTHCKKADAL